LASFSGHHFRTRRRWKAKATRAPEDQPAPITVFGPDGSRLVLSAGEYKRRKRQERKLKDGSRVKRGDGANGQGGEELTRYATGLRPGLVVFNEGNQETNAASEAKPLPEGEA